MFCILLITDNTAQVNTNTANIATNTAAIAALPTSTAWNRIVNQTQAGGSANFNVTGLTSTKNYSSSILLKLSLT